MATLDIMRYEADQSIIKHDMLMKNGVDIGKKSKDSKVAKYNKMMEDKKRSENHDKGKSTQESDHVPDQTDTLHVVRKPPPPMRPKISPSNYDHQPD